MSVLVESNGLCEKIIRPNGIHGNADTDLSPELYRSIGRALGSLIPPSGKFLVGSDYRASSPAFLAALIEGLVASEVAVVDLGNVPAPLICYGITRTTANACAIVSGDDAPADNNGLHWRIGKQAPCPEHFALIDVFLEKPLQEDAESSAPAPRTLDITYDYVAWYQETWFDTPSTPLRIVVDPMQGSWAGKARRYLQATFPHMLFSAVHDTPDPTFGGRTPSGALPERLEILSWEVDHSRADIGFAFDADGSRLTIVDGHGVPLQPEKVAWFLLDSFMESYTGEVVLHDAGCSELLLERLRREGAELRCIPRGNASFWSTMRATGACFGIETGGFFYFRCLRGNADPFFTACWVLDHLATLGEQGISFTQWRKSSPRFSITPEIKLAVSDLEAVLSPLSERWRTIPCDLGRDGYRWQNTDGWLHLREAHEPDTVFVRVEGRDKKSLANLLRGSAVAIEDAGFSAKDILRAIY